MYIKILHIETKTKSYMSVVMSGCVPSRFSDGTDSYKNLYKSPLWSGELPSVAQL